MLKKTIWILSTVFWLSFAQANEPAAPTGAALPDTSIMDEIEDFSNKTLNTKKDYPSVKRIVELLLVMDDHDPSRSGVMLLSHSYNQNQKLYDKAIKDVAKDKSKEQKKQLEEIKTILKNYYQKGQDY